MKILIVEDHLELNHQVERALKQEQYTCETCDTYLKASEKIDLYNYDVAIIDINLPDGSGLDLIKEIKGRDTDCGIIIISARAALDDKIQGLDLGADDYLTKPFSVSELIARTKALIRRRQHEGQNEVSFSNLTIDTGLREVYIESKNLSLTRSEYAILTLFIANPKRVLTKETLAEHIWGDHMDMVDSFDFIYSHIRNLRSKLLKANSLVNIKAVYGIGYKLHEQCLEEEE